MRLIVFTFLIHMALSTHAQITLKIWPNGVPGARTDKTYKEQTIYIDQNSPRISQVTDPELTVFPAPKEIATGTAVVICPGGGYGRLAIDKEGTEVAKWLNNMGVTGIVLKYRLPSDRIMEDKKIGPLQDVQEAIRLARKNATKWSIDPHKIGVMGFSAGGHLAGTASTMYREKVYNADTTSARPDFSILIYGVLSLDSKITHRGTQTNLLSKDPDPDQLVRFSNELHVDSLTPPTFLVHSEDDRTVPVENSLRYFLALRENNVPSELHVYQRGGHGYGLATKGGTESNWPDACREWLKQQGLLSINP